MPRYATREELVKAMDEAEKRLRAKYEKDGKDDLTWRLTQVSMHLDLMIGKTGDCRYHTMFEAIEHAADEESGDMALMCLKAAEWADSQRAKTF